MDKFFTKFAPYIIIFSVIILHTLGYLAEISFFNSFNIVPWIIVTLIDAIFAFKCGSLIRMLYKSVYKDPLTGLSNRGFFYLLVSEELEKMRKNQRDVSLLMIDIDNFKSINDNYGHVVGDEILKQIADVFSYNIRQSDSIVRWGGEEFSIILPRTNSDTAMSIAERIRAGVESTVFCCDSFCLKVTISIGIISTDKSIDIDSFVKSADEALYKAKEKKNVVIAFSDL